MVLIINWFHKISPLPEHSKNDQINRDFFKKNEIKKNVPQTISMDLPPSGNPLSERDNYFPQKTTNFIKSTVFPLKCFERSVSVTVI